MVDTHRFRSLVAVWAIVETSLFGGVIYGWPSLVYVLKEEGIYSYLCAGNLSNSTNGTELGIGINTNSVHPVTPTGLYGDVTTGLSVFNSSGSFHEVGTMNHSSEDTIHHHEKCEAQDSTIALGQTIAASLTFIGTLLVGQLHKRIGTRILRIEIWVLFIAGCLCTAFVSNDAPWLIFVSYWMVAVSGLGLLITNVQVSYLFTTSSNTVISILCGGYDFAGSVMLFMKLAYERGVTLRTSYLVLIGGATMTLISAICWLPKGLFERHVPVQEHEETKPFRKQSDDYGTANGQSDTEEIGPSTPSLRVCCKSPLFLLHVLWYNLLQIRFINFVSYLNPYLIFVTNGDVEQVSHFTNVFLYLGMFGFVTSFLAGITYDWQKAKFKDCNGLRRALLPSVLPLTIASGISVLLSALILVPHIEVLYVIFVLTTVYRSFMYSMAAAFISQIFPTEYFSVLYTAMVIAGGFISFVQYPLYYWSVAYEEGYTHVSITLLALVLVSFVHPLYIYIVCRRDSQKHIEPANEDYTESSMVEDSSK